MAITNVIPEKCEQKIKDDGHITERRVSHEQGLQIGNTKEDFAAVLVILEITRSPLIGRKL